MTACRDLTKLERGNVCKEEWMIGPTAGGAHLLFTLLLIAADLQVILQHSAQRQRDTCYCSPDLLSARIRSDLPSRGRRFPFMNIAGKWINYTAEEAELVHVRQWGGGQWMEHFAALKPTRCSAFFFELGGGKPDCFFTWKLSVWQVLTYSQECLGNKEDVLGRDQSPRSGLYMDILERANNYKKDLLVAFIGFVSILTTPEMKF